MLTCIACSKQLNGGGSYQEQQVDDEVGKHSIKSLTARIKDMAVKASVVYKSCKPCSVSSRSQNSESTSAASGRFYGSYRRPESSNSTPERQWGKAGLKGLSSGGVTPLWVSDAKVFMEEDEAKEWVAQVEPGVLITFLPLPQGGNSLKKIQFSREMFNKLEAQRWWGQNYEKVMELYNVQRSIRQAPPHTSVDEQRSKVESAESSPATPPLSEKRLTKLSSASQHPSPPGPTSPTRTEATSGTASARSSSSHEPNYSGELSVNNASDAENEWVEEDEPGVYITLRSLPGGIRELRRVRFSRERFGEMQARVWWEENRARIQEHYLG